MSPWSSVAIWRFHWKTGQYSNQYTQVVLAFVLKMCYFHNGFWTKLKSPQCSASKNKFREKHLCSTAEIDAVVCRLGLISWYSLDMILGKVSWLATQLYCLWRGFLVRVPDVRCRMNKENAYCCTKVMSSYCRCCRTRIIVCNNGGTICIWRATKGHGLLGWLIWHVYYCSLGIILHSIDRWALPSVLLLFSMFGSG
jgi:hypothetical protein